MHTCLPTAFVRAVDWIDTVWPAEKKAQDDYPKVSEDRREGGLSALRGGWWGYYRQPTMAYFFPPSLDLSL
jgi:hypothetical protein